MAITISPLYPVVDKDVTFTSDTAVGDHSVIAITSLPSASEMTAGLMLSLADDYKYSALVAVEEQSNADAAVFDVPGEYGVTLYDISELPGLRATDNSGSARRFVINSTDTTTVHVGAIIDLPISTTTGRGATLRLQVNDTTVRAASLIDPTDEGARVLGTLATVAARVAGLIGETAATMGTALIAGANDLLANYEAHRVLTAGGEHADTDTTNVILHGAADSVAGAISLVNALRVGIVGHCQTTGVGGGLGVPWHGAQDWANVPLAAPAHDVPSATVLLLDLRERCYESHRVQIAAPAVHGAIDNTNVLTPATALDDAQSFYLDALVMTSPPVPAGEPEGAHDAAANFGFRFYQGA